MIHTATVQTKNASGTFNLIIHARKKHSVSISAGLTRCSQHDIHASECSSTSVSHNFKRRMCSISRQHHAKIPPYSIAQRHLHLIRYAVGLARLVSQTRFEELPHQKLPQTLVSLPAAITAERGVVATSPTTTATTATTTAAVSTTAAATAAEARHFSKARIDLLVGLLQNAHKLTGLL